MVEESLNYNNEYSQESMQQSKENKENRNVSNILLNRNKLTDS
jgi:hypothetical protein